MTRLEQLSNIAVIVVAATVLGTNLYDRLVLRTPKTQAILSQQFIGKPLPLPASLATGSRGTITLFISHTCHFCTESMSFYKRLESLRAGSCDIRLTAVGPKDHETREDMQTYLSEHNLVVDGLELVNFNGMGITGTPTLVLRDGSRLVRGVWVGYLPKIKEDEILAQVLSLCHS